MPGKFQVRSEFFERYKHFGRSEALETSQEQFTVSQTVPSASQKQFGGVKIKKPLEINRGGSKL